MKLSDIGEKKLVEQLRARLNPNRSRFGVVVDIGDDTAALEFAHSDKLLLFTCDMLVEEIHFRRAWHPAEKLGWKALAINISDIAAMGGQPKFAVVSAALPGDTEVEFVEQLYAGLQACAQKYGVMIVGGDSVGSRQGIVLDVSLIGEVERSRLLKRSGACSGDLIAVTGPLGGAAAGLKLLQEGKGGSPESAGLINALLQPQPRLKEAQALSSTGVVSAMMDLSDGLADDLPRLCQESMVGARIYAAKIPFFPACPFGPEACLDFALRGGEDYELLFTLNPNGLSSVNSALTKIGSPQPIVIGEVASPSAGVQLLQADGTAAPLPEGYKHFNTS